MQTIGKDAIKLSVAIQLNDDIFAANMIYLRKKKKSIPAIPGETIGD